MPRPTTVHVPTVLFNLEITSVITLVQTTADELIFQCTRPRDYEWQIDVLEATLAKVRALRDLDDSRIDNPIDSGD